MTHDASATFFALRGRTYVYGQDVLRNTTSTASNTTDHIYVYPGSTVGFRAAAWNGGNYGIATNVSVHNRTIINGNATNGPVALAPQRAVYNSVHPLLSIISEAGLIAGFALNYNFHGFSNRHDWAVPSATLSPSTNPGYEIPGTRLCRYVSASAAGYNIIPYLGSYITALNDNGLPDGVLFSNIGPIDFIPGNWAGLGVIVPGDAMACAEIAYNYNLLPSITTDAVVSGASTLSIQPKVEQDPTWKAGQDPATITRSQGTRWQISQFYSNTPTPNIGPAQSGTTDPCTYIRNTYTASGIQQTGCSSPANGTGTVFSKDPSVDASLRSSIPAPTWSGVSRAQYPFVCYVLSVNSYRPVYNLTQRPTSPFLRNGAWNNSRVFCPTNPAASKKPQVEVNGDDVRVGRTINTSLSQHTVSGVASLFGSWAQYASYSVGSVTGFSTQSGLKNGVPDSSTQSMYSKLTFANVATTYGNFVSSGGSVNSPGATGVKNLFAPRALAEAVTPPMNAAGDVELAAVSGSNVPYYAARAIGITSNAVIPAGKTVIIVATGKVTIKTNIAYVGTDLTSVASIPQVVIVAPDISIAEGVTNVDAWLIADSENGTIDTCDPRLVPPPGGDTRLTDGICNQPLTVNGPVVTETLRLNRTYGAGAGQESQTAERFNNRGESYLWALNYLRGSNQQGLVTTSQRELPPRY